MEKRTGHVRLASELEFILRSAASRSEATTPQALGKSLSELPLSRRHGESLASLIPRELLEHHMVLPEEIECRFARIESEYAARERLGAYGFKPRKTVLLYGSPGCGKSLGAKRIAWNTGLPLMKVRFDALLSSYFGESASNLRAVFESANERPCVLLLDECDFIARSRTAAKDVGEASRIVNSLLQLMEEYDAPGLLVATTNIDSHLDSAIFRRFDDVLMVPLPGPLEILKLLKATLSAVQVEGHLRWDELVASLVGASAAHVVKAAQDAAKAAILSGRKVVTGDNLVISISELKRADGQLYGEATNGRGTQV